MTEQTTAAGLIHRNIQRHSTIFDTIAAACEVTGTITARPPGAQP